VMLWWATRSTALVALVLLSLVLALGVAAGSGSPHTRVVVQSVHRGLSLLAVALVGAHVGTVVVDGHVDLGMPDVVVPFGSSFRTLYTGLGTLALDLLLAVAVTSGLRTRLGGRAWRAVHGMAYVLWPLAALHGLGAGTDAAAVRWLTLGCAGLVALAVAWRLARGRSPRTHVLAVVGLALTGVLTAVVLA
jgi:methionine sulfoxide reductase heme-binding subunit